MSSLSHCAATCTAASITSTQTKTPLNRFIVLLTKMLARPLLACGAYTALYVGALYALPALFDCVRGGVRPAGRDNPRVIVRRIAAAAVGTVACLALAGTLLWRAGVLGGVRTR